MKFPLLQKHTDFGSVPDVLVPVDILTRYGYQTIQFVLDTGADFTMLPRHMADVIGIDVTRCLHGRSFGIEGRGVKIYCGVVAVRIGNVQTRIRCLFSDRNDTPYLLGRADIFEIFKIIFDGRKETVELIPFKKNKKSNA